MSTANFKSMKFDMPMVCGKTYRQLSEEYQSQFGEAMPDSEYEWQCQNEFEIAVGIAEEFNNSLVFHDVTVECGYYDGFQFYVDEKYSGQFDMDSQSRYCIDNEDAHYYFDMYRSQVLRAADREKRKITKWLESLEKQGYNIVVCTGRFSNGEASYSIKTNRTALIAAVMS